MPDTSPELPAPDLPPVPAPASEEPTAVPPPSVNTNHPHSPKGLVILLAIIVLLALAGSAFALYGPSVGAKVGLIKSTPTPTPSVGVVTSDLGAPLQALDTSIGDLETNLSDSDTVLSDKQGDLSE